MQLNLSGKRALVCGSSQGLGFAAAVELAILGASVTLLARDRPKLELAKSRLNAESGQTHDVLVADFSQARNVEACLDQWLRKCPGAEIVVNNSGGPPPGPASEADPVQFLAAFEAHLVANQTIVRKLIPFMRQQRYGRIINIISTSVKQPIPGLGVSNTVRGAVANWAKTLANELGQFGITVNNVLPGATRTARLDAILQDSATRLGITFVEAEQKMLSPIPAGRFGEPHEIGSAIAFLASPAASYINGINLPVDGGRTQCL